MIMRFDHEGENHVLQKEILQCLVKLIKIKAIIIIIIIVKKSLVAFNKPINYLENFLESSAEHTPPYLHRKSQLYSVSYLY